MPCRVPPPPHAPSARRGPPRERPIIRRIPRHTDSAYERDMRIPDGIGDDNRARLGGEDRRPMKGARLAL